MTLEATVEQIDAGRFRARARIAVPLSAEAGSREQALEELRRQACQHIGSEEITIQERCPWAKFASSWNDESDPEFDAYWKEILDYRRELDQKNRMGEFAPTD